MTNTKLADEAVIKTDVKGRVRTGRERREQLLDEFERSGLSGQKFAALAGIKYPTFATWAQKRRRARGAHPVEVSTARGTDKVKWLEAVVEAARPASGRNGLVLELPGGAKAEVGDVQQVAWAAELLRALAGPC